MKTQIKFTSMFLSSKYLVAMFIGAMLFCMAVFNIAYSHELRPSVADLKLLSGDRYQVTIATNVEALISKIGAEHLDTEQSANAGQYDKLRSLSPAKIIVAFESFRPVFLSELEIYFDGVRNVPLSSIVQVAEIGDTDLARESLIVVTGKLPKGATQFKWVWPKNYGASIIRVDEHEKAQGEGYAAFLRAGVESDVIALKGAKPLSFFETVRIYIEVGFTHIIPKGLDHILFVVGLFLLSVKLRALLWQITAFTIAHTVTLALGMLGFVTISAAIVEPLIAASIIYVAVENIMTDKLQKWRPFIVFCFGLLHGLGFAGVLASIGLNSGSFITGLISFNIGVELGQFAIIAICYFAVGYWFGSKTWYRKYISIPASVFIALIALWWVYERVFMV